MAGLQAVLAENFDHIIALGSHHVSHLFYRVKCEIQIINHFRMLLAGMDLMLDVLDKGEEGLDSVARGMHGLVLDESNSI